MGLQRVEAGRYACGLDLGKHGLQVLLAVRVGFLPVVVAEIRVVPAVPAYGREVEEHHAEAALPGPCDVLVDCLGRHVVRPVYRCVQERVAPALNAARQVEIFFQLVDRRQEPVSARPGDKRGLAAAEPDVSAEVGVQQPEPEAILPVDLRVRIRPHDGDCGAVVPDDVQPLPEAGPVAHGQLQQPERHDWRNVQLHAPVVLLVGCVRAEALQREERIAAALPHAYLRLVRRKVEPDDEQVAFAPDAVRLEHGALRRVRELHLVVVRTVLRGREKRDPLSRVDALLAGCLYDQRLRRRVAAYDQPERVRLDNDVSGRRDCREHC